MAVCQKIISGKFVNLRSVDKSDSNFIVKMRSCGEKNKYIHAPPKGYCVKMQDEWLKNQRADESDYYFLIQDKDETRLGTIGIYHADGKSKTCEIGRWVSYGNSVQNTESALLALEFAFFDLRMREVFLSVMKDNKAIRAFWKNFGAKFKKEIMYEGVFPSLEETIAAEDFPLIRKKINGLLNHVK